MSSNTEMLFREYLIERFTNIQIEDLRNIAMNERHFWTESAAEAAKQALRRLESKNKC